MSNTKNIDNVPEKGQLEPDESNLAASASEVSSVAGSVKTGKTPQRKSTSSERQIKFERAQKCLENAALVSKRIKEHRKATAELLGRPFEEDDIGDAASEIASNMSERTSYSVQTDTSTTLSVQDALNIPGISESLANTLKQKELLMERIKQYKEISKRPMTKSSSITLTRKESTTDSKVDIKKTPQSNENLLSTLKEKENTLSVMQVKMRAMETTILDLQEKINEKDQIIEAKNKATTLMSDSLSKKEKDSLALLEDTRQQMTKMQENFIAMETEWTEEKQKLLKDIEVKEDKIKSLEEANTILESSRFEISVEHSKLVQEIEIKNNEIAELQEKIQSLNLALDEKPSEKEKDDVEEEKGSREITDMVELTKKIELLEQLNCQIRQTNKELQSKLASVNEPKQPSSPSKKGSPLPSRKGRSTAAKLKSPWSQMSSESLPQETDKKHAKNEITRLEMLIQSLNKDLLDKEYIISQKDEIIASLRDTEKEKEPIKIVRDIVEIGVNTEIINESLASVIEEVIKPIEASQPTTAAPVHEHPSDDKDLELKLNDALEQIGLLTSDLEAANKNMVKVKSNHKLKLKQMQKTIDNFSKVSDANAEIVKLNEELNQLTQKVAELEEEKGNLQLHLVDYDSGRLTESDVYKKLVEMENLAETRLKAISVLETQKFDLVQEIHILQQKNAEMEDKLADISHLQSEQVSAEIKSVQLEEQLDKLNGSQKELELIIENLKLDKEQLNTTVKELEQEKEELNHKLENYIQENMDLTDKLEKLSAEKVSSAESIEIVESLTTQEKLELEEYNKGMTGDKIVEHENENVPSEQEHNIEELMNQIEELNKKVELFTQEREEVMEKMNTINVENEKLHDIIKDLNQEYEALQLNIEHLSKEKQELQELNQDLTRQIEELKRERNDIVKETAEMVKSVHEDNAESSNNEPHPDDKAANDKGLNRTKSVKQLTKEILKLKNTIKEREDEIADCQMKILSLEEQQQKQNEIMKANSANEKKLKSLSDENQQLKEELDNLKKNNDSGQQYKQLADMLQLEIQKLQQDYSMNISSRDTKINELESMLVEYEKQIFNYSNTLQQKDKDLTEYVNQIKKLNDVSQKLKSTIELLQEEKAKDQNAEVLKSLNKQIVAYQKKMAEAEERLRNLEDEKSQLNSVKAGLENKNVSLDAELKKIQDSYAEKQKLIVELQTQQQKHSEDLSAVVSQAKERDAEIHEIKLQLRKESIENEKLRTKLDEKDTLIEDLKKSIDEAKEKINILTQEKDSLNEQFLPIENKNKELMEKLKKFAINIKKKSAMYSELENQLIGTQKQLETQNQKLEQYHIQVETLPALQEKLKHAEEEINRLQSQRSSLDILKTEEIDVLKNQINCLEESLFKSSEEITKLNDAINILNKDLHFAREENTNLSIQIDMLNNKIGEYEVEQKNNANFVTKYASLQADVEEKQAYIAELLDKLEHFQRQEQQQFGYDAKIQERDLYIETLETEINKYKSRICRLEESISIMEDRRHSLERKADQLDSQLQEKEKAYVEYSNQEDELVSRLAVLMDHDRVIDKQLHEIENENKDLQIKIHQIHDENQRLRKSLSDIQEYCNTLVEKASKFDFADAELVKYHAKLNELEGQLKKVSQEHHALLSQKKKEIEDLESEFNTQIENAIKDKKQLGEKHEKLNERVSQLEGKLQEYKNNNDQLNANLIELNRIHQDYVEKSNYSQAQSNDYTDQYINEINSLNAMINAKNQEIADLNSKINTLQTNHLSAVSNLEGKIANVTNNLQSVSIELDRVIKESDVLKENNTRLQKVVNEQESCIKDLKDKKRLSFEMNIPKTEGMLITSTIEPLNEESKGFDMSSLESQILSEAEMNQLQTMVKKSENLLQAKAAEGTSANVPVNDVIVPKKAYLCYQGDDNILPEVDPFNSDEGWGLGEGEVAEDVVTPGMAHLNQQIAQLSKDKDKLKAEVELSNTKLIKAMKKLKELKSSNDILSNELRLSKQMSQSSFLDSAIEDELRVKVEELEKTVSELTSDINKERKEKDSLRKQNEVFNNANERLTEMKEKMDSELELWKYKFKEVNDKMSTLQWGSESKDSPKHELKQAVNVDSATESLKQEIVKIERENEELQTVIDQFTHENNHLLKQNKELKIKIDEVQKQLGQRPKHCENCESLKNQVSKLLNANKEIDDSIKTFNEKLELSENRYLELSQNYETVKSEYEKVNSEYAKVKTEYETFKSENERIKNEYELLKNEIVNEHTNTQKVHEDWDIKYKALEQENMSLKQIEQDSNNKISALITELKELKSIWPEQTVTTQQDDQIFGVVEKYENLCSQLKQQLDEAQNKALSLETTNQNIKSEYELLKNEIRNEHTNTQKVHEDWVIKYKALEQENMSLKQIEQDSNNKISALITELKELKSIWPEQTVTTQQDDQIFGVVEKYENLCSQLKQQLDEAQNKALSLETTNQNIKSEYELLKNEIRNEHTNTQKVHEDWVIKYKALEQENMSLKQIEHDSNNKISALITELKELKSIWPEQTVTTQQDDQIFGVVEKYENLCSQLKQQLDEAQNKALSLETTNQNILEQSDNYVQQIKELNEKIQHLNAENDNLLSNVAELRSSISSAMDQRGFEIAELWKQHLAQREADFQKTEAEFRSQLNAAEAKYEQLLDSVQTSSQEETNKLVVMEQVNTLHTKLQDKEEHLRDLQDKYADVMSQLDMLRSEMQDENATHENKLLEQQEEYEKVIKELHSSSKENSAAFEQSFANIQAELASSKAREEELIQKVDELKRELAVSENKIKELESLLLVKENEIYQKTHDYTLALTQRNEEFENVRKQLLEFEKKVEELSYEKESELAVLRLKMHENSTYYEKLQGELENEKALLVDELSAKISECVNLNKQITDLNMKLEEDAKNITEMTAALENQEVDIVTLKDEITHLETLLKASTSKIQKHVSFASDTKLPSDLETVESEADNKEMGEVVPVGELDLALYMLHQRDVRCEELTMELTQLLEERDTLQLRLSDSLRLNEEMKSKVKEAGLEDVVDSSRPVMEQPSFSIERETPLVDVHRGQISRSGSVADPDADKPKLQAKLSELRTVHHKRDIRIRQESELRQLDMQLMQRDFSNLPPEAVEQLTQAHHTLSRDSQSTSTVLLNWLRGRSTPKVVHM